MHSTEKKGNSCPAFLLAQVGAHAASKFAERLAPLGLTPPDAGILRLLRVTAGVSQQELAAILGIHPSQLVALLDELEQKELVERITNADDRRHYSLHLTEKGTKKSEDLGCAAHQHQEALCAALTPEE